MWILRFGSTVVIGAVRFIRRFLSASRCTGATLPLALGTGPCALLRCRLVSAPLANGGDLPPFLPKEEKKLGGEWYEAPEEDERVDSRVGDAAGRTGFRRKLLDCAIQNSRGGPKCIATYELTLIYQPTEKCIIRDVGTLRDVDTPHEVRASARSLDGVAGRREGMQRGDP